MKHLRAMTSEAMLAAQRKTGKRNASSTSCYTARPMRSLTILNAVISDCTGLRSPGHLSTTPSRAPSGASLWIGPIGDGRCRGLAIRRPGCMCWGWLRPRMEETAPAGYSPEIGAAIGCTKRSIDTASPTRPLPRRCDDGLSLTDCYIGATVRCAPPDNKPRPDEFEQCRRFLQEEIALLTHKHVRRDAGKDRLRSVSQGVPAGGLDHPVPCSEIRAWRVLSAAMGTLAARLLSSESTKYLHRQAHPADVPSRVCPGPSRTGQSNASQPFAYFFVWVSQSARNFFRPLSVSGCFTICWKIAERHRANMPAGQGRFHHVLRMPDAGH